MLYFQIFGYEEVLNKTIILLNPNRTAANIEILALNNNGFVIDHKTFPFLSSMENLKIRLSDIFDENILDDISMVKIASNVDILGTQFFENLENNRIRIATLNISNIITTATACNVSNGFDYPVGSYGAYGLCPNHESYSCNTSLGAPSSCYYDAADFKSTCYNGIPHLGEDWNRGSGYTDYGDTIYAVSNGEIVYAQSASGWGKVLIIRHVLPDGSQVESLYGHLKDFLRTSGCVVRGEPIGTIGDGGGLYSSHLHFEIRYSNCTKWGQPGPGYSTTITGWTDPSQFIDSHRSLVITPILRIDGGTSSTKSQGSTFYFTGSNYKPNGAVTRYLKKPNGTTQTLATIYANSSGNVSWSYTSVCADATGTYSIWAKDNATGKTSNTVSEIITFNYSCDKTIPNVTALSVSPTSNPVGKSFTISYSVKDSGGSGLKQVELWCKPNGGSWSQIKTTTLSGQTSYSGSFSNAPSTAGTYWYGLHVVDRAGNWNDEQNSRTGYLPGKYGPDKVIVYNPPTLRIDGALRAQGHRVAPSILQVLTTHPMAQSPVI